MRPPPLQFHNTSRNMAASGEKEESLVDFLKDSEALAILHEQQVSAVAAQKAAAEISERLKQNDTPLLSSLRRKLSSTFVKDAPEQPKRVDQDSPSPLHSKSSFFRKTSNTKSSARGDSLQSISENDTASPRASDVDNRSSQGREEQPVLGKIYGHTEPAPVPKAPTHRPILVVDTAQAIQSMTAPTDESTLKNKSGKDKKSSKQSSPSVIEPSSKFSQRFMKPRTQKFKDSDPEVKEIERMILQEEFGVNTTPELTSAYRKRPRTPAPVTAPSRGQTMSFAESAASSYYQRLRSSQANSNRTTNTTHSFPDLVHKRETSNESMESTGSVVRSTTGPHNSFGSGLSATGTFDSRASTFPSSALRTSGGTSHSITAPSTPETSYGGGSLRFGPKEVGSGYSHENYGSLSASPTSYLAGAGYPVIGQHSSNIFQSPVRQGTGRSVTDPYDGQASIGSVVRAARAALLDLYGQSNTDSTTYPFEQHTMSSHDGSFADSNVNRVPRPLRRTGGGSLESPSDKVNTSSDTGSYEIDVLRSRGHGSNEFSIHPDALSGAGLPISHAESFADRNQPLSGLHDQGGSSAYNSYAQANNQVSNPISGSISGSLDPTAVGILQSPLVSGNGSSRANSLDVSGTRAITLPPFHPSPTTVVRDFQNLQTAGAPSNRFQLEENAEEDRRRRRMTKQNYVAYRVSPAAREYPTTKADLFMKLHILRKKTKTEIIPWDGHDNYPRHPNHGRKFHCANLWCNQCTDKCARCSASCCVLKATTMTAMSDRVSPLQRADAVALQKEIQNWLATGVDNPTFMDCTECKQFVCPKCISICPVEPCCDRLCIGCNPENFWQPCDFHTKADIEQAFKRQREQMEDNLVFMS